MNDKAVRTVGLTTSTAYAGPIASESAFKCEQTYSRWIGDGRLQQFTAVLLSFTYFAATALHLRRAPPFTVTLLAIKPWRSARAAPGASR